MYIGLVVTGSTEAKFATPSFRFLLGFMKTFWLAYIRVFLVRHPPQGIGARPGVSQRLVQVPVSCMFGSESLMAGGSAEKLPNTFPLLNWQCGATSQEKALIGIGVTLAVLYTMVLLLDTIGHDCDPRSFSAIAGPSPTTDTFTVLTQIAMAVCFSLMRYSEALWGKLITPVALFLLSVCQGTHTLVRSTLYHNVTAEGCCAPVYKSH